MIGASGADIVGIEEGEHNAGVIAEALGWYASDRTQVISRFPIVDPPGADGIYVWVEVLPGRFVAIGNVHLPSDPYGPYGIRDGASLAETLELEESVRLPAIQEQLAVLPALAAAGFPTFLTGDFNSPSHLDWTAAVSAVRPEVPYPVDWPVSRALADAGFRDSYREVHPNPLAVPGFTWTPGGPESDPQRGPRPDRLGPRERPGDRARQRRRRRGRRAGRRHRLRPLADRPPRRPLDVPRHAGGPGSVRGAGSSGASSSATSSTSRIERRPVRANRSRSSRAAEVLPRRSRARRSDRPSRATGRSGSGRRRSSRATTT